MKEVKDIRSRIQYRHGQRSYSYHSYYPRYGTRGFFRFIITCMTTLALVLGVMTLGKTPAGQSLTQQVGAIFPLAKNALSQSFLAKWIPFESWFNNPGEVPVATVELYEPGSKTGYFISENQQAIALYDGLIVYIGDDKGKKWIVVHHDNELYATYGNLTDIEVKLYDRVLKGDIMGHYDDEIMLEFLYQNEDISYEEAKALEED